MGLYDTLSVKCCFCRRIVKEQTKALGKNCLDVFEIGDKIPNKDFHNCIYETKFPCHHCKKPLRILIEKGIIKRTTKEEPRFKEGFFGEVNEYESTETTGDSK